MIPAPSSGDALVENLTTISAQPASSQAMAALADLHVPVSDFLSTALSARIGLLARAAGMRFVHHELLRRVPFPAELGPEVPVWDGETVPVWTDGILETPKYFSFFLDTALPPYNPNHRRKWRPHEALHGLVTFFWRPDMTRFETYVGARIAELLPVTHWYGYDEILRPHCPVHRGTLLYRHTCEACEQRSAQPYWNAPLDDPELIAQSHAAAARAQHFLATELAAIDEELATGRRVWTHHPRLNSASDAEGYLKGHHNRLTAWSFGATVEHFLVDGVDYQSSPHALRDHMLSIQQSMLEDTITIDAAASQRRFARRVLRMLGYRTFVALEWLSEGSTAEDALMPVVEAAAELSRDLLESSTDPRACEDVVAAWLQCFADHASAFPPEIQSSFEGMAVPGWHDDRFVQAALPQMLDGLSSAFPNHTPNPAAVLDFLNSTAFQAPGSLRRRYGPWSGDDRTWFNGWLHDLPHRDADAELFATLPDADTGVPTHTLRLNTTLRRQCFPASLVAKMLDADAAQGDFLRDDGSVEVAAVWWEGAPRIIPLDPATAAAIDAVAQNIPLPPDAVHPLLESGMVIYLPPCRSN